MTAHSCIPRLLLAAVVAASLASMTSPGYAQHAHQHAAAAPAQALPQPPHGGQLTSVEPLVAEVVYLPQEIRVYLYGPFPQPLPVGTVTGHVALQPRAGGAATRLVLRPAEAAVGQQGYLAAAVNMNGVKDGDWTATLSLENAPLVAAPVAFAQTVVMSKWAPQVAVVKFDATDSAAAARQQVCAVMGSKLGSMGTPVKVLVDGKPVYLCCAACLPKLQANPLAYLEKVNQATHGH